MVSPSNLLLMLPPGREISNFLMFPPGVRPSLLLPPLLAASVVSSATGVVVSAAAGVVVSAAAGVVVSAATGVVVSAATGVVAAPVSSVTVGLSSVGKS